MSVSGFEDRIEGAETGSAAALRISASLYTTWKRCPAQARARLDGIYAPDTIDTFRGLLAHRVFARHIREGRISPVDFPKVCKQEIGSSNLNWKMRDLGITPRQLESIILVVGDLYRRFPGLATAQRVTDVEVQIDHDLGDGISLTGRIDAVSSSPSTDGAKPFDTLVDWKTGDLGDAGAQLRFYALLWTLARGHMPLSTRAISVQTGEIHSEWFDRKVMHETQLEVVECAADLSTPGEQLRDPGTHCRWCPILEDCVDGQRVQAMLTGA